MACLASSEETVFDELSDIPGCWIKLDLGWFVTPLLDHWLEQLKHLTYSLLKKLSDDYLLRVDPLIDTHFPGHLDTLGSLH